MKIQILTQTSVLATALLLATGCAHHRDVRRGAEGLHKVVVRAADKEEGTRSAIAQANDFCKQSGLSASFVSESQAYTGDLDEKDYVNAKRATKVVQVVGSSTRVLNPGRRGGTGDLARIGGAAGDAALGEAYTVTMRFKCQ